LLYRVENTHRRTLIASAFVPLPVRFDILIVEDDADQLSLFTEVLALAGYAVHGVSTAANAVMTLRAVHVGLLVTDIRLGSPMNGFELADLAQSIQPSLQTLFITGFTKGVASRQRAARPDAQILLKPFSLEDLVRTVSQFLNRSVFARPALS
jgi:two-component system cell cycle response regulator CpdR